MEPLKADRIGTSKWRILAIPFGGPLKDGKDTDGEFFSPRTDIKPDWFPARPVLFHHGQDPDLKDETFGMADDLSREDDGWWVTTWLDRSKQYFARINALLAAGKMYGSSGSVPHLAKIDHHSGEILVWPYIEQTLTPTPANLFSRVTPAKAVADFTSAGLALPPDLETYLTSSDGGESPAIAALESALLDLRGVISTY